MSGEILVKINRLFEMVYMLLDRNTISAKEFANYFGVSVRTVYRYVDELSCANIPVYMKKGKGGGISLLPDYTLSKTALSAEEKNEILASLKAFESLGKQNYGNQTAINKLSGIFGSTQANWLEVDFSAWTNKRISKETFNIIKSAIINRQKLAFQYYNAKSEKTNRIVDPLKLMFKSTDWYLYAFCTIKKDCRYFKLKRMEAIALTGESFEPHIETPHYEDSSDYPKSNNLTIEAKLEISKEFSCYVVEEYENYKINKAGNYTVTLETTSLENLATYILSYGSACKALEPPELIDIIKQKLNETLKQYL